MGLKAVASNPTGLFLSGGSPRRKSTIVLEGHSFVAHNSTANSSFGSAGTAPVGNGYTYSWGVFEQAMIACDYPFRVIANNGVGGNTTAQILARIPADLALNPGWIYLDVLTNDSLNQVPLSTTIANVTSMLQQCNAANVAVIFALDGARYGNGGVPYTQAQITLATEAANYFKDYALDNPNVIIFDQAPFRWDTTSVANSLAYTPLASVVESDNVHPNPYGAWLSGTQGTLSLGAILAPFLWGNQFYTGPSAGSDGSANGDIQNIVENPLLCGTGGTAGTGCTGTVPTNVTIQRTSTGTTAIVASIVQRSSLAATFPGLYDDGCFGNVVAMQISGGSTLTAADSAQIQFTPVGSGNITSLSGSWEIECEVAAVATSGTIAEIMLTAFINSSGGGYTTVLNNDQAGWGGDPMNIPTGQIWQGKLRSRPFYAPASAIVGGGNTQMGIQASPSVGGAMTLYVSNPKWRLIQA